MTEARFTQVKERRYRLLVVVRRVLLNRFSSTIGRFIPDIIDCQPVAGAGRGGGEEDRLWLGPHRDAKQGWGHLHHGQRRTGPTRKVQ